MFRLFSSFFGLTELNFLYKSTKRNHKKTVYLVTEVPTVITFFLVRLRRIASQGGHFKVNMR